MVEYERSQDREPTDGHAHKICVVGIGGGGLNVLDRICLDRLMDATLVSMHTDVRVLSHSMGPVKIQLGAEMMRGIGCGGDPELGREAAEASRDQIREALQGHEMVFICAGLGGGTGSGAAPVVAEIAKELGALVFVFATTPFTFEGRRRLTQSEVALEALQPCADALILFENNRMAELVLPKEGIQKAFSQADQLVGQSVRAISTMVSQPGIVRVSLADLTMALRNPTSRCLFGFGEARGTSRVQEALKRALKSPLVNQGLLLQNARNLIVHVAGGESLTLAEVDQLMKQLGRHVPEETQIMFGVTVEPKLGDLLTVTLMSSLSATEMALESSLRAVVAERPAARPAQPARPATPPPAEPPVKAVRPAPAVSRPAAAETKSLPELLALESEKSAAEKLHEVTIEELFAHSPPAEAPVAAQAPEPEPEAPAPPSSADLWFAPVEPAQTPAAQPEPIAESQAAAGKPEPTERASAPPHPAPAQSPPLVVAEALPVKPPVASGKPAAIVKTSIFSVIDDEEEEEEASPVTNWAEKYIQPKQQPQQQPAAPQLERREAEPSLSSATTTTTSAKPAPATQKQPSLNLHQESVGRFKGTDKTIVEGEDLDVPTWMRMRGKVAKTK